jgi:hypothetical protein
VKVRDAIEVAPPLKAQEKSHVQACLLECKRLAARKTVPSENELFQNKSVRSTGILFGKIAFTSARKPHDDRPTNKKNKLQNRRHSFRALAKFVRFHRFPL